MSQNTRGDEARGHSLLTGRRWWTACALVLTMALLTLVPTTGDFGLTYDEPAYRYSQMVSSQWWEGLFEARSLDDLRALLDPDALLYYWPYARHGINFHPPLAGQLDLLTHAIFGHWMKDIPSRRMASVIAFALTVVLLFGFLARRYGAWVGLVAAGSLLLMPRLYGQAHLAETDIPGLLIWTATALAFWKGLHEPRARRWRVAVGVLAGLAFVEKMATVLVLLPILAWLVIGHLPRANRRAAWLDGLITSLMLLLPLGITYLEIRRLARLLPPPANTDLFVHRPEKPLAGRDPAVAPGRLARTPAAGEAPARVAGLGRRAARPGGLDRHPRLRAGRRLAGQPRLVARNPAEARPLLPAQHRAPGALPDIQVLYFGQVYEYSLPWHNAWVLLAITVPLTILAASALGLLWALWNGAADRPRAVLPAEPGDLAGDADAGDPRARRRSAVPADVRLPGGPGRLGCGRVGGWVVPRAVAGAWGVALPRPGDGFGARAGGVGRGDDPPV